jgi:sugar O-acyltransferase (sialic acid O-acetyltransferase NeuD family)
MRKRVAIIGAGGHGKVIADAVLKSGEYELVGFVDANLPRGTAIFRTFSILESQENIHLLLPVIDLFIIGIGANAVRKKVIESLPENLEWATVIHPSAIIASETKIGKGSIILANSVIGMQTIIGEFCIVDAGVIVDHECEIGAFCHLSIGTCVGSNSKISSNTKSEIGQLFQPFSSR